MTTVLAAIQCLLIWSLFVSARRVWRQDRTDTLTTLRALRPWMFVAAPLGVGTAAVVALALFRVPWLRLGWLSAFGATGSVITGGGASFSHLNAALSIPILTLLLIAIPREARIEEEFFRAGNHHRSLLKRSLRAVGFGLIHLVMGVPIAAGIALIIAGILYDVAYQIGVRAHFKSVAEATAIRVPGAADVPDDRPTDSAERAGIATSTALHVTWNYLLMTVLVVLLLAR